MPIHFGVTVREGKRGLKLTRENYAVVSNKSSFSSKFSSITYADDKGKLYTNEWCEKHLEDCLKNFDLNTKYFSLLDHEEFNQDINKFLIKNKKFKEVINLNNLIGKSGYYIMVLDEYSQLYIGTSNDIMKRIRQHWIKRKSFDRILFPIGNVESSIISIDSFRAYDTTRIFALMTKKIFDDEDKYIKQFSPKFLCNRIAGGKIKGGLLQVFPTMKNRPMDTCY